MNKSPILNIDDLKYKNWGNGGRFEAKLGALATELGARKLGYRMVVLAPGKTAWPYHSHYVNEEMLLVLEGTGTLRYAGTNYSVKPGDVVCCPPGPETPHQVNNTSDAELKYLVVSTMETPEIAEYPDSGKLGISAGVAPGGDPRKMTVRLFCRTSSGVDYWDGES
jgi:uncharacterized cupin superfamily protein